MQIELLEIDFNSEEAIYMQLRNQIILGIATSRLQDGDTLPSVRQMAECIGINMQSIRGSQKRGHRIHRPEKRCGDLHRFE